METRYIKIRIPQGEFTERVGVVRTDKRGTLVEAPAGAWFPWKGQFKRSGDRFYVKPNQARKNP